MAFPVPAEANLLLSFHYHRGTDLGWFHRAFPCPVNIFVDSGGFSAMSVGAPIKLTDYARWVRANAQHVAMYANLDAIGDPIRTARNQEVLEAEGLQPVPVFHVGSDLAHLKRLVERYEYIAIGGMVPFLKMHGDKHALRDFLARVFDIGKERKLHGFGVGSWSTIKRYPWASTDAATYANSMRHRCVYRFNGRRFDLLDPNVGKKHREIMELAHAYELPTHTLTDYGRESQTTRVCVSIAEVFRMEEAKRRLQPGYRQFFALSTNMGSIWRQYFGGEAWRAR